MQKHATLAQQEVRRIAHISVNTLKFSRQTTLPTETQVHEVVDSVLAMYLGRVRHSGVRIVPRYRPHGGYTAYATELRQVIANFIGNALDATGSGGRIHVRVREAKNGHCASTGIAVTIADTGVGISQEDLDRIYEAFFTTKEKTGTGLGLWLSKELIEKHHGRIQVRSRQANSDHGSANGSQNCPTGQLKRSGTVFRILLPYENGLD